jgi:hypothetical protein
MDRTKWRREGVSSSPHPPLAQRKAHAPSIPMSKLANLIRSCPQEVVLRSSDSKCREIARNELPDRDCGDNFISYCFATGLFVDDKKSLGGEIPTTCLPR